MEIKLNPNLDEVNWNRLTELFEKVNWGRRPPEIIRRTFEKSSQTVFIYDKDKLIAFGRTVDDGKFYALLVDIIVDPEYQRKGIGTIIINNLKEQLNGYSFVTLIAEPTKKEFYKKIGWKKQSTAFIWPTNKYQLIEHCEKEK
jgi:ribosomal protein S18 acetylase RimI-like enzyme